MHGEMVNGVVLFGGNEKGVGGGETRIGKTKKTVNWRFFCMANSFILKYWPPNGFFISN
jgi:hypothetical protein